MGTEVINLQRIPKILKKAPIFFNAISGIIVIFIFLITSVPIFGAGETALNFLRIGTSARGAALADSLAADYMDSSALQYNPAALIMLKRNEIQLMHIDLYADIDYESAVYVSQFDKFNIALSLNYLHTSAPRTVIDTADPYGYRSIGNFVFQDRCIGVTITPRAGIWGGRVKYIEERIEDEKAGTTAVDFGFLVSGKFSYGVALQNIGPEIKFIEEKEQLPMTLNAAVKLSLRFVSIFISGNYYNDRRPSAAGALEVNVINALFLRGGYNYIPEENAEFNGFTVGAGIKIGQMGLDYAFIPFGEFGNTQRFSLGVKF